MSFRCNVFFGSLVALLGLFLSRAAALDRIIYRNDGTKILIPVARQLNSFYDAVHQPNVYLSRRLSPNQVETPKTSSQTRTIQNQIETPLPPSNIFAIQNQIEIPRLPSNAFTTQNQFETPRSPANVFANQNQIEIPRTPANAFTTQNQLETPRSPAIVFANQNQIEIPKPYEFGFQMNDGNGTTQHREEVRQANGDVKGSYGYTDPWGMYRKVVYFTDEAGYHATVHSNEPGLDNKNSANVEYFVENLNDVPEERSVVLIPRQSV